MTRFNSDYELVIPIKYKRMHSNLSRNHIIVKMIKVKHNFESNQY